MMSGIRARDSISEVVFLSWGSNRVSSRSSSLARYIKILGYINIRVGKSTSSPRRSRYTWPGIGPDSRPILARSRPVACLPRTRTRTPPVDPARPRSASDPSETAETTGT